MGANSFILRNIKENDIEGCKKLSDAEGWNQTKNDWAFLIKNPQNINFLCVYGGKIIGTTTALIYNNLAWIGMVLVDERFRGKGVSKLLLTEVFGKLIEHKSIKLDATLAGQKVYEKFGFQNEYLIDRMTSHSQYFNFKQEFNSQNLELFSQSDLDEIIKLDEVAFGVNRRELINYLTKNPENSWTLRKENKITGFVLGRNGEKYYQIGPVISDTDKTAKILISKALENLKNQLVVIDILQTKVVIINWLNSINFTKQRHFVRMYKNDNIVAESSNNLFAIAGPELG